MAADLGTLKVSIDATGAIAQAQQVASELSKMGAAGDAAAAKVAASAQKMSAPMREATQTAQAAQGIFSRLQMSMGQPVSQQAAVTAMGELQRAMVQLLQAQRDADAAGKRVGGSMGEAYKTVATEAGRAAESLKGIAAELTHMAEAGAKPEQVMTTLASKVNAVTAAFDKMGTREKAAMESVNVSSMQKMQGFQPTAGLNFGAAAAGGEANRQSVVALLSELEKAKQVQAAIVSEGEQMAASGAKDAAAYHEAAQAADTLREALQVALDVAKQDVIAGKSMGDVMAYVKGQIAELPTGMEGLSTAAQAVVSNMKIMADQTLATAEGTKAVADAVKALSTEYDSLFAKQDKAAAKAAASEAVAAEKSKTAAVKEFGDAAEAAGIKGAEGSKKDAEAAREDAAARREATKAAKEQAETADKLKEGLMGMATFAAGMVGFNIAMEAIEKPMTMLKEGMQAGTEEEQLGVKMKDLGGSAVDAVDKLEKLKDFVAGPLGGTLKLDDVAAGVRQLQLLTGQSEVDEQQLAMLGAAAQVTGKSFSDVAVTYGRVVDQIKLGMPIRAQLLIGLQREGLISMDTVHKVEALTKAHANHKVILAALDEGMKQNEATAEAMGNTYQGLSARLNKTFEQNILAPLGGAITEALKGPMEDLIKLFNDPKVKNAIQQMANDLQSAITRVADTTREQGPAQGLIVGLGMAWDKFNEFMDWVDGPFGDALAKAVGDVLKDAGTKAMDALKTKWQQFVDSMKPPPPATQEQVNRAQAQALATNQPAVATPEMTDAAKANIAALNDLRNSLTGVDGATRQLEMAQAAVNLATEKQAIALNSLGGNEEEQKTATDELASAQKLLQAATENLQREQQKEQDAVNASQRELTSETTARNKASHTLAEQEEATRQVLVAQQALQLALDNQARVTADVNASQDKVKQAADDVAKAQADLKTATDNSKQSLTDFKTDVDSASGAVGRFAAAANTAADNIQTAIVNAEAAARKAAEDAARYVPTEKQLAQAQYTGEQYRSEMAQTLYKPPPGGGGGEGYDAAGKAAKAAKGEFKDLEAAIKAVADAEKIATGQIGLYNAMEKAGMMTADQAAQAKKAAYDAEYLKLEDQANVLQGLITKYEAMGNKAKEAVEKAKTAFEELRTKQALVIAQTQQLGLGTPMENFVQGIKEATAAWGTFGQQTIALGKKITDEIANGMGNALTQLEENTGKVGDAFKSMANAVLTAINEMIAKELVQLAVTNLLRAFGQGGSVSAAGGNLVATSNYGNMAVNSTGGQFQTGGLVYGPSGYDKVPSSLTAGEFVLTQRAVNKYGLALIQAMNNGTWQPGPGMGSPGGRQGYAMGGFVGSASSPANIPPSQSLNTSAATSQNLAIVTNVTVPGTAGTSPGGAAIGGGNQPGGLSTQDIAKLQQSISLVVRDEIIRQKRPGGLLSRQQLTV